MRQLPISILFLSLLISPITGLGQASRQVNDDEFTAGYDAAIRKTLETFPELPGAAVVVVKGDKPVFIRGYGLADKEAGTKAGPDTLYYIASSTKSFMALAAALLDREGKIKLDDPFTKYARGVTFANAIPDTVTVRDLLTHTSGLKNGALTFRMAYSGEVGYQDMVHVLSTGTTYSADDHGKFAYSNLGYNIYGLLLKLYLNKNWQDVLQDKVFAPLKMKRTSAYMSKARATKLPMAEGYLFDAAAEGVIRSPLTKYDNNMQSAGGMVTTASDLARWLAVNMNDGMLDGHQVFPTEVMAKIHTGYADAARQEPPFDGKGKYGLGWNLGKYRGRDVIHHNGGYPGWSSHISFMPGEKIGVAVLINESTAGGHVGDAIAANAYDRLLGSDKTDENYSDLLTMLSQRYAKIKNSMTSSARERFKRVSQLTLPLDQYAGRYHCALLGNIEIVVEQSTLGVRMGNIHVMSTPYTTKDSIRVEMIPGQGEIISFKLTEQGKVESLSYSGETFVREKSK